MEYIDKKSFVRISTIQIETYKAIKQIAIDNLIPTIKLSGRKVLSKRITTKAKEVKELPDGCYIDITGISIKIWRYKHSEYCRYKEHDFSIVMYWDGLKGANVIDAEKTIESINSELKYISNGIAMLEDCIANYDTYVENSRKLERAIKEYRHSTPYDMQVNLSINGTNFVIEQAMEMIL